MQKSEEVNIYSLFRNLLALCLISLCVGCATLLEGPKQKIIIHCEPNDNISVITDGAEVQFENGVIELDKKRDTHFVTLKKAGYHSTTLTFNREINSFWPIADVIWIFAAPIAWFVDWQTGALYQIDPKDVHVVLRKKGGGQ